MKNIPLVENRTLHYQQDGAPTHNAAETFELLNRKFGNQWIGNRGPINQLATFNFFWVL